MENKDELRKLVRILVFILAFAVSGVGGIGILIIGAGVAGVVANVGGSIIGAGLSIPAAASAVAIPKLFGMSAKAKASEIGPAAGTWIKLQQAYIMETDKVGDCSQIGYTPPGNGKTGNFTYKCGINKYDIAFWVAENNENLDECKAGNVWAVFMNKNGEIEVELPDDKSCQKLSPNFSKLSEQTAGKSQQAEEAKRAAEEAQLAEEAKRAAELEAIMGELENTVDISLVMKELEAEAAKWQNSIFGGSYKAHEGTYFSFKGTGSKTKKDAYGCSSYSYTWTATSKEDMGDCPAKSVWKMQHSGNDCGGDSSAYGTVPSKCKSIAPKTITDYGNYGEEEEL